MVKVIDVGRYFGFCGTWCKLVFGSRSNHFFYGPKLVLPFITSCFDSRITNVNNHLSIEWFENCWCKYYDTGFTVSYLFYFWNTMNGESTIEGSGLLKLLLRLLIKMLEQSQINFRFTTCLGPTKYSVRLDYKDPKSYFQWYLSERRRVRKRIWKERGSIPMKWKDIQIKVVRGREGIYIGCECIVLYRYIRI